MCKLFIYKFMELYIVIILIKNKRYDYENE